MIIIINPVYTSIFKNVIDKLQLPSKADRNTHRNNDKNQPNKQQQKTSNNKNSGEESRRSTAVAVTRTQHHSIGRDGPSVLWALAATDGLTVETGEAKLSDVLNSFSTAAYLPSWKLCAPL